MIVDFKNIVEILDLNLSKKGEREELVICGGASLILQGIIGRATRDMDVIVPKISDSLKEISIEIANSRGLSDDWLNNGPESVAECLPEGWRDRVELIYNGKCLKIFSICRADMIITKLDAMANRRRDLYDLVAMKISEDELRVAGEFVKTLDAGDGFGEWVEVCIKEVLEESKSEEE